MFDFHMHSRVSFDSEEAPENMVRAAEELGLTEICFTDHYDHNSERDGHHDLFSIESYKENYDGLKSDKLKIRNGVEFGLTDWNQKELTKLISAYPFDFVIGSVHYVGGYDPYVPEYWVTDEDPYEKYLLRVLECVKVHSDFDVLGHINYVAKSPSNTLKKPLYYREYSDICDEIMKIIAERGIGMEINSSGIDRIGEPLPSIDFIRRFSELGGEIVTIGSDAHIASKVGAHNALVLEMAKEVFGGVYTFEKRKPIFHRL